MLVVPRDPLLGDLARAGWRLGCIHRLLDRPARGALVHFDGHPGLLRGPTRWRAQVRLLVHLDEEPPHHIATQECVIRGAADRQAMLRGDDLYAVAQGSQHPGRAQHIARFA